MNSLWTMLDILRLRRGPQDLPADGGTLIFWLGIALVTGMAVGIPMYGTSQALILNVLDLAVLYLFIVVVLRLGGVPDRWRQTFTAMAGTGALLGLLMALLMLIDAPADPEEVSTGALLALLTLVAWLLLVFGHILQQALELGSRLVGMLMALGYVVVSSVVTQTALGVLS
ncbi:conserved hypothetical protein [Thioalkalivibrio sp. K90mix]|uniref:hypothetical protein n=1 Tax=Thioalkalivibrio sp. (strain K90mix) TaxID=396595 RepID=UPI000195A84D|nr:hypothetical protein [Thioalkalivibrio sp. K90mix]ADC70873.1 conserved hypothetical protein [Thioalkalivibrio sp. K90mix]